MERACCGILHSNEKQQAAALIDVTLRKHATLFGVGAGDISLHLDAYTCKNSTCSPKTCALIHVRSTSIKSEQKVFVHHILDSEWALSKQLLMVLKGGGDKPVALWDAQTAGEPSSRARSPLLKRVADS